MATKTIKFDKKTSLMFDIANLENDLGAIEKSLNKVKESKNQTDRLIWIAITRKWLNRAIADKNQIKKVM
jgi:hypothetical protein